jgi:GNAT superfamily N-acetyltransferase
MAVEPSMSIEITESPAQSDEEFVIEQVRAHNRRFTDKDVRTLCAFARADDGTIIGGLLGRTYWEYLEVSYLWVSEAHRKSGQGTMLMAAAEAEAVRRGCKHALLDTFSFQALGFYQRQGYEEFGRLAGFSGQHRRHYMHKVLDTAS